MTAPVPGVERDRAARLAAIEAAPPAPESDDPALWEQLSDLIPCNPYVGCSDECDCAEGELRLAVQRLIVAERVHQEDCGDDEDCCNATSQRARLVNEAAALTGADVRAAAGPDQHQAADDGEVLHADLCELLNALGLGAYARPYSAHEVMQRDAIPMARALRTGYDEDRPALERVIRARETLATQVHNLRAGGLWPHEPEYRLGLTVAYEDALREVDQAIYGDEGDR